MAEYPLTNTASDIDAALQKVVDITTTPLSGNINTVTSGGVHAALQSLNYTNMDAGFLVTESEGINSNDTDTQIPTCAAVKDFFQNNPPAIISATYTATQPNSEFGRAGYSTSSGPTMGFTASTGGMSINSSGEAVVPTSGSYVMIWRQHARDDNGGYRVDNGYTIIRYKINGSVFAQSDATGSVYPNDTTWLYTREKSNLITLTAGDRLVADARRIASGDEVNYGYGSLTLKLVTPFYTALVDAGF